MPHRILSILLVLLVLTAMSLSASAEQSESFGDYVVHYNALTTDLIEPSVARPYGILRSKNRALINISVQKKVMGTIGQPVSAEIAVTATNLNAQLKQVDMRQITSGSPDGGKAIYYIGELPVEHEELVTFSIEVKPQGAAAEHTFSFKQQFFTR